MPIYEYLCGSCKKKTEVIQGMNDPRLKVCPHCAGKLTKAFSAPAIQFKGSGFYITDYRSSEYQAKAKAESSDSAKPTADPAAAPKESPKEEPKVEPSRVETKVPETTAPVQQTATQAQPSSTEVKTN